MWCRIRSQIQSCNWRLFGQRICQEDDKQRGSKVTNITWYLHHHPVFNPKWRWWRWSYHRRTLPSWDIWQALVWNSLSSTQMHAVHNDETIKIRCWSPLWTWQENAPTWHVIKSLSAMQKQGWSLDRTCEHGPLSTYLKNDLKKSELKLGKTNHWGACPKQSLQDGQKKGGTLQKKPTIPSTWETS